MISQRIKNMAPSATSSLLGKVAERIAAGEDIVKFNVGEPDFPTPQIVTDSCKEALDAGRTKYVGVSGIAPLKEAVCAKLSRDNGLEYKPGQIVITTGAKQALYNAVMTVADPGTEVIIPVPAWVSYVEMVKLAGAKPVLTDVNKDYSLNIENIRNAVTDKTSAIIINTPNNPTGAVYSEESLRQLADIAVENDIIVISDEVYEKLVYGYRHVSIASLSKEIYERTIVVNGFSKAFSMTGWRIGYSASAPEFAKAMTSLQGHVTSNSTTFVQYAAIDAMRGCSANIEAMRREFEKRRDYMYERFKKIPGIEVELPQGAFYFMPDFKAYIGKRYNNNIMETSQDICEYLLDEAGLAVVFGEAFYMPGTIRFSYSNSMDQIKEGMDRLETALNKLV